MSERTWGDIEKEVRDDYLRADGPENINFREVQWDVWRAEVERAAAARALEEAAEHLSDGLRYEFIIEISSWEAVTVCAGILRARAAEIREGE